MSVWLHIHCHSNGPLFWCKRTFLYSFRVFDPCIACHLWISDHISFFLIRLYNMSYVWSRLFIKNICWLHSFITCQSSMKFSLDQESWKDNSPWYFPKILKSWMFLSRSSQTELAHTNWLNNYISRYSALDLVSV